MSRKALSSFGFSGSGFLAVYHLGVTKCLLEHGHLNLGGKERPMLTGVSGGALTIAGIAAGVDPDDGMQTTLDVAKRTRQEGFLDAFQPRFSLVDQVEERLLNDMRRAMNNDEERFLDRIDGGTLLRIGLSERLLEIPIRNPKAYCYVDQFRDMEDVIAASILSSFIPGVTGPLAWSSPTISRASARVNEMMELGFIKKEKPNGEVITVKPASHGPESHQQTSASKAERPDNYAGEFPLFLDGGLSNAFPVIDESTVVVTPISGVFDPNPFISPELPNGINNNTGGDRDDLVSTKYNGAARLLRLNDRVKIHLSRQNAYTLRRIVLSSDEDDLHKRFQHGYNDAKRFLEANNLTTVHSTFLTSDAPSPSSKKSSLTGRPVVV